jgi:hypothetical protein
MMTAIAPAWKTTCGYKPQVYLMSEEAIRRRILFGTHTAVSLLLFYLLLMMWGVSPHMQLSNRLSPTLYYILPLSLHLFVIIQFTAALMIFLKREREDREKRKRKHNDVESTGGNLTATLTAEYTIGDDGELIFREDKRR